MNKLINALLLIPFLFLSCKQDDGKTDFLITIKTPYGDMKAILYDETPKHKENFIKLAKEKYFDDLLFHRVIEGFMIQGGDPDSRNAAPDKHLGVGGPGFTIPAEINEKFFHEKGALSAARLGDEQNPNKESSGSQFYIVQGTVLGSTELEVFKFDQMKLMAGLRQMFQDPAHKPMFDSLNELYTSGNQQAYQTKILSLAPRVEKITGQKITRTLSEEKIKAYTTVGGAPHLDGEYSIFGKVIKGLDVIDKIAVLQKGNNDRPLEDVKMTVTVEEMSRKKISSEYNYEYPSN